MLTSADLATAAKLRDHALTGTGAYELVSSLTTEVGPRQAGSPGDAAAVAWAVAKLKALGLSKVHTQPTQVSHWVRGPVDARIDSPWPQKLTATALGGSVATPPGGIDAEVIELRDVESLKAMPRSKVEGKIVFLNTPMNRTRDDSGYGAIVRSRSAGARTASPLGAVAILIRSIGTDHDRLAHTGAVVMHDAPPIPAAALAIPDAELLHRELSSGKPVRIHLELGAHMLPPASSANVIGEIPGTGPLANEVVLLAAHLDSWDLGTGALDDGAGVAIVAETARQILLAGLKPRRTIRVVLFASEEYDLQSSGHETYSTQPRSEIARHVFAMEADLGQGPVWRLDTNFPTSLAPLARALETVLKPLGIERGLKQTDGGNDVVELKEQGVPIVDLVLDASDYFDYHHTAKDTLDKVQPEKLDRTVAAYVAATWLAQAHQPARADLLLRNGRIYTLDARQSIAESVAIRDGKIIDVGTTKDLKRWIGANTKVLDLEGRPVYPGFKDSHTHLLGLGLSRLRVDLIGAKTYDEVIKRVKAAAAAQPPGAWILGRGWHEAKWDHPPADTVHGFPVHQDLSAATPNNPVMLTRADGHAVLANSEAMRLMNITAATSAPAGGEIIRDAQGNPTGVFVDAAEDLVKPPAPSEAMKRRAWDLAFDEAIANGITAADEAGLDYEDITLLKTLGTEGRIPIRLYAMLGGWPALQRVERPEIDFADGHLTIRAVKLYADGALGSRGAALLEPYKDDPGNSGLIVTPIDELKTAMRYAHDHGFQVATHAIGDRANRMVLDLYQDTFAREPGGHNLRWRIEHAQILDRSDIPRFANLGVIASMQTIHATSDGPWAPDRIGTDRMQEGAYAWRKILKTGAHIANGTDTPVENINPIANFYAGITYDPSERMTRDEALRSYTTEGAYATFTDANNGTIERGKNADFTVLTDDIMKIPEKDILKTHVAFTVIGGKVYPTRGSDP